MPPITVAQAIRNAIESEQSAGSYYLALVPRARDEKTRLLLQQLAREEEGHARRLRRFAEELAQVPLPDEADALAHLIEGPPHPCSGVSFVKALHIALEAEHHAAHFYEVVAEATTGNVSEVFLKLAAIERRHARAIERVLDEATSCPGSDG